MVRWDRVAREEARWHQGVLEDLAGQVPTPLVLEDPWEDLEVLVGQEGKEHQWDLVDQWHLVDPWDLVDQWDLEVLVGQEVKEHQWDQADRWGQGDLGDQEDQEDRQDTE
jgi:hypothetical protein